VQAETATPRLGENRQERQERQGRQQRNIGNLITLTWRPWRSLASLAVPLFLFFTSLRADRATSWVGENRQERQGRQGRQEPGGFPFRYSFAVDLRPAPTTGDPTIALFAALTAAAFFALFASRLCPDLCLLGDSAELVTAAALWGVPHPPGYPLFTLIGHAFAAVPFGALPWRVHLTSAVFHAGTLAATVVAAFSVTRSRVAAVAAGFALGLSRSFLLGSLYAEVFPLNDLFFACLLAIAVRLHESPREHRPACDDRALLAFASCGGFALAHHMMIVLAAPALALAAARPLAASPRVGRRRALGLLIAFVASVVLSYAFVPLAAARSPELSWGDVHDVRSLLRLVTRQDYGGPLSAARHASSVPGVVRVEAFARLAAHSLGGWTLVIAAAGLLDRLRRAPGIGGSLALAILLPGPLFAWANALETGTPETLAYFERFTTMAHVPLAVAFGAGVAAILSALPRTQGAKVAAAVGLCVWAFWSGHRSRDVDLGDDRLGAAFAHDLVLQTPRRSLVLLSGDAPANAALYVCAVERRCDDRIVLSPGLLSLPWDMVQVRRLHPGLEIPWTGGPALQKTHELVAAEAGRRPVFVYPDLLTKDPGLAAFTVFPDRLLVRVSPAGSDRGARAAFAASARAMARGECEGCRLLEPGAPGAPRELQTLRAYEAAFRNHALFAGRPSIGDALSSDPPFADLADIARACEERATAAAALARAQGGD
jgi:Protein of unknown function (DUF2723)